MNRQISTAAKILEKYFDRSYLVCLVPLVLLSFLWITRSFPHQLSHNKASIERLSKAERININVACHKINDLVLKPNEKFSFNKIVGPRKVSRGFLDAPSYENGNTVMTTGGGICLVSSLLYKSALEASLTINKRQAHSRPIRSVEPGFDATVDYGRHDLVFTNNSKSPVLFKTIADSNTLDIRIFGVKSQSETEIVRDPYAESNSQLAVKVFRKSKNQISLISNDHYKKSAEH